MNKRFWLLPLLVISILLLGAYLRLYRIDEYLTFLGDEGRDVIRVRQMLVEGDLIFLGPTASVGGFFLGPLYYYLMAPFLWLWKYDPVGPAVMVALFGVGTIYLVYYFGKKVFHTSVGITAALLYALSPLTIAYSRSSWNPNVVPFFSLLLMILLWRTALIKKLKYYFIIGLLLGAAIQFHYLFSFLFVVAGIWLLTYARPKEWLKSYILVGLGFFTTFSPLIIFELKYGFPNIRAMISFFLTGKDTGFSGMSFIVTVFDVLFRSFGRLLYRMPNYELWNGYSQVFIVSTILVTIATLISGFLILAVFIASNHKRIQYFLPVKMRTHYQLIPEKYVGILLFGLWFITPILLFGLYRKGIYDYYFGIFYPVPFLIIGTLIWQIGRNKILKIFSVVCVISIAWYNWLGRPFVFEPNRQLQQTKNVSNAVLEMANGKVFNFAFITATNSDHAYRYFFEVANQAPVTILNKDVDPERKSVTDQLIVMCENKDCQPLGNPLWEVAGFGQAEIVEEKDVFPVTLYKLVHVAKIP